jgi:glycosyltransferase involved in cell wall biosynthesis
VLARDPRSILFLHTTSEVGGSDVSLVRLVEGLDRARYRACVALPSDGPLVPRLKAAGATVIVLPAMMKLTSRRGWLYLVGYVLNFPRALWALRQLIRRERIDLIHSNTIHILYGGPVAWLTRTPHVWHIREIVWQKGWLRRLELWMARHLATRVIVTSDAVAAMFGELAARPSTLVKVSNGIETDRFHPGAAAALRTTLGVAPNQTLVGIVCRLDVWKGVDVFIDAAVMVARARPDVRFVVVGGPVIGLEDYAATLRARATARGIDTVLTWTDWTYGPSDMPDVHRAIDILVLASSQPEPFGLVIVEGMASGRPVIATAHGGPCELIEAGVTGLLVAPGNADALAAGIMALVTDPDRAAAMGAAGRLRAESHYSSQAYIAGVHRVYDDVFSGAGGGR